MGVTDEVSQDAGRVAVSNVVCIMCAEGSASIAAHLVRTDPDILSSPGDFLCDNLFRYSCLLGKTSACYFYCQSWEHRREVSRWFGSVGCLKDFRKFFRYLG
ncbi:hypothetical protein JTB14_005286 [Gonioctena quinquepunctata]|nr:hypothetical protein JTB14_005286 [Gonioctena quinquepunctata]